MSSIAGSTKQPLAGTKQALAALARWKQLDHSLRRRVASSAVCLLISAAALGVAGTVVITGQIARQGIDALFLLVVCLLFAFAFSMPPLQLWRSGQLQQLGADDKTKPGEGSPGQANKSGT